jgi:hypothetical protein
VNLRELNKLKAQFKLAKFFACRQYYLNKTLPACELLTAFLYTPQRELDVKEVGEQWGVLKDRRLDTVQ